MSAGPSGGPAASRLDHRRRLSLNQATTKLWPTDQAVSATAAAGLGGIGLWREQIGPDPVATARAVSEAGLAVTSLCRGGFFPAPTAQERAARIDDNRRALDEAAALGTDCLVLVCGGLPAASRDLDGARAMVADGIAAVADHAASVGVRLAIEPMHPMFGSDRSVVVTLGQALDLAAPFPPSVVGVTVDSYHLWWDPQVWSGIERAGRDDRIAAVQISDWVTPLPEGVLLGRGLPGKGCIDNDQFLAACDAAGWTGPVEVEVFHQPTWDRPGAEVVADLVAYWDAYYDRLASGA